MARKRYTSVFVDSFRHSGERDNFYQARLVAIDGVVIAGVLFLLCAQVQLLARPTSPAKARAVLYSYPQVHRRGKQLVTGYYREALSCRRQWQHFKRHQFVHCSTHVECCSFEW